MVESEETVSGNTVVDFLEELPRRLLSTKVSEEMYRRLVKGDKEAWNSALATLSDVDACGLYPPTAPSCERWLKTLATVVAALAKIMPENVDDELKEKLENLVAQLGLFILTGDTRSFADC
jgi:hypothetical protein